MHIVCINFNCKFSIDNKNLVFQDFMIHINILCYFIKFQNRKILFIIDVNGLNCISIKINLKAFHVSKAFQTYFFLALQFLVLNLICIRVLKISIWTFSIHISNNLLFQKYIPTGVILNCIHKNIFITI